MGYPTDYFTVLFALGRLPGWIAQWEEMLMDREQKIARPRQIYVGADERPYVPMAERCGRLAQDWWTKAIAMLPSPTAAATRLTGLERTSPQAKMPGTLVSSRYGSRSSSQRPAAPRRCR